MKSLDHYFHLLSTTYDLRGVLLNNPFEYRPSQIILDAQHLLLQRIEVLSSEDVAVAEELTRGKMFGVMVVRDGGGRVGYLAAFSGCMAGRIEIDDFVPPIFGRGDQNPQFESEDRAIGAMGRQIDELRNSADYIAAQQNFESLREFVAQQIDEANRDYKEAKRRRELLRKECVEECVIAQLQRESQHQKGELRRLESRLKGDLYQAKRVVLEWKERISQMVDERRESSFRLQCKMFKSYRVINGCGEWSSLYSIFDEALHRLPPSGAGECAAPKLLQYALTNSLIPIALGEFWYGPSPRGEVRHHGHFYGACRGRCLPILTYMLQGVDVAPIDVELQRSAEDPLAVIFEDEHLVIFNKPSGLLSVPGRSSAPSVKSIVEERYPMATGALMVHRLDQDTSGILVVAKSGVVHKALQRQFSERKLSKRYIAVVEGYVSSDRGDIELPLIPNINDRPRQMVDFNHGKPAHTSYEVLARNGRFTRLALTPHTGRTHQLRLHCAHVSGLNTPIVGDRLYSNSVVDSTVRLHLHAERITFTHPISEESVTFVAPVPF